jgi:hypothetical protein
MPYLSESEVIQRALEGNSDPKEALPSLFDRQSGLCPCIESSFLDYKLTIDANSEPALGELARDILGFSNAQGGIVILGVDDTHIAVGLKQIDIRLIRDRLGPFMGTRVTYDMDTFEVRIGGKRLLLAFVLVPKTQTNFPHLLRKDIVPVRSIIRKPKYVKGTLFYREEDSILSESPFGDIDSRARELGFSGAGPRTSSSFQIMEDRPLLRLYSQINDRFFGRTKEINQLVSELQSAKGRGISLGGFGGLGKTELAINVVTRLYKSGAYKMIYSASAKQTVLGSMGLQQVDPIFVDLHSFLTDFCGWLGINVTAASSTSILKELSLKELAKFRDAKILIFVDNLETVRDRDLFDFLDQELPANCYILSTSRVHRLRRYLLHIELSPMDAEHDAAQLLRHELKRQGLSELASRHIDELVQKAREVLNHPLAIRWFAWSCRKDQTQWGRPVNLKDMKQIEDFCVSSTLDSLGLESQKVLGAILVIDNPKEATANCIQHVAAVDELDMDLLLWDLECSGMLSAATDENGITTYSVSPMAQRLTSDISRQRGWERDYVARLKQYAMTAESSVEESPLVRELLSIKPISIRVFSESDRQETVRRIDKAIGSASAADTVRLLWRKAECARHSGQVVTADEIYTDCANRVLATMELLPVEERWHMLLEAATVARTRAVSRFQVQKAINYLEAAEPIEPDNSRLVGMLAELYGMMGDRNKYNTYKLKADTILQDEDPDTIYALNLRSAISRGRDNLGKPLKK